MLQYLSLSETRDGMTVEFIQRAISEVRVTNSGREHRHMSVTSAPDASLVTHSVQLTQVTYIHQTMYQYIYAYFVRYPEW